MSNYCFSCRNLVSLSMSKTKIYFIELQIRNKVKLVCDLVEKLYNDKLTTAIYCQNKGQANLLDKSLWTWKQETFIPHLILTEAKEKIDEPAVIAFDKTILPKYDVLVLFNHLPYDMFGSFKCVIDFAEVYDKDKLRDSRSRYKTIRDTDKFHLEFIKFGAFLHEKLV